MVLEFLREAADEVEDATSYYEACEAGLGLRFRTEAEQAIRMILKGPLHWRERNGGYRRINLWGFPYYIAYFIRGEHLVVAAVAHGSRHPDYWKKR
jgi:plasmid stabilization system protein ParE